jgi:hypothetical protein
LATVVRVAVPGGVRAVIVAGLSASTLR